MTLVFALIVLTLPADLVAPTENPGAAIPSQLDRADIVEGIAKAKAQQRVGDCARRFDTNGTVMVQFVIAPKGTVSSAKAGGALWETDAGRCVEEVMRSVRFKPFRGPPMAIGYPFLLRAKI
jgi:hypothetical protein